MTSEPLAPGSPSSAVPVLGTVALRGLWTHGRHGVLLEERRVGQPFLIDAVLTVDVTAAVTGDDLAGTVDYGVLAEQLSADVASDSVQLIETLAYRLAGACLRDPHVLSAEVTVHKPSAPIPLPFVDVSVTVRRERDRPA